MIPGRTPGCREFYILKQNPGIAYQPQSASPIPFTSNNPRCFADLETHFSTWLCTSFRLTLFLLRWGVTKRARWLWHRFRGNDGSHFKFPLYNFASVSTLDRRIWHSVKLFFKFHASIGKKFIICTSHKYIYMSSISPRRIFPVRPTFYQPIDIRLPDAIKEDTREFLAKWQQSDVPSYSPLFATQESFPSSRGAAAKILRRGRLVSGINPALSRSSHLVTTSTTDSLGLGPDQWPARFAERRFYRCNWHWVAWGRV